MSTANLNFPVSAATGDFGVVVGVLDVVDVVVGVLGLVGVVVGVLGLVGVVGVVGLVVDVLVGANCCARL
jgi:hypothetical protein